MICICGWFALRSLDRGGDFLVARPGARLRNTVIAAASAVPFMILVTTRRVTVCIVLVAAIEAVYQAVVTRTAGVMTGVVALHLFLFGLVELSVYRRFDFVSMFVFRISYYAYWHLAWAHFRLEWLFPDMIRSGS